jgi:hypothetical protein
MNACLQALFACPAFDGLLQRVSDGQALFGANAPTLSLLSDLRTAMKAQTQIQDAETYLTSLLTDYPAHEMHDACEFLNGLLDKCADEGQPRLILDLFGGSTEVFYGDRLVEQLRFFIYTIPATKHADVAALIADA